MHNTLLISPHIPCTKSEILTPSVTEIPAACDTCPSRVGSEGNDEAHVSGAATSYRHTWTRFMLYLYKNVSGSARCFTRL